MAKIAFEFDTESKKFGCTIDGQEVPDAKGVEVYPSWDNDDEFTCSVVCKTEREDGIIEVRRLMASAAKGGTDQFPSADFPGFSEARESAGDFHKDFADAFGVKA